MVGFSDRFLREHSLGGLLRLSVEFVMSLHCFVTKVLTITMKTCSHMPDLNTTFHINLQTNNAVKVDKSLRMFT